MSGGSFDYLYMAAGSARELGEKWHEVEAMVDELRGYGPVADRALAAMAEMQAAMAAVLAKSEALADVWHAAEWARSGDWGRNDTMYALERFNALAEGKRVETCGACLGSGGKYAPETGWVRCGSCGERGWVIGMEATPAPA